jgi:uncharacterized protein YndB with AHSA1/START domain
MASGTDRIEKKVVLRAPLERVWRAISDPREFGAWFGVAFDGGFVAGGPVTGRMVPTQVDPEVARLQEPFEGAKFSMVVDRIEAPRLFSFRWHPFAIDPKHDYSGEPTTLVVFELEAVAEGTRLTITETGFDGIPLARRAAAFTSNDEGWTHQAKLVEKYLARAA